MKIEIDWNVILIIIACVLFIYQERIIDVYMYAIGLSYPITGRMSSPTQKNYTSPKMLFRQNGLLYLHSVNEPVIPGVNPLIFHTYQDYLNYCNFRQSQGIYTPVLQIQNRPTVSNVPVIEQNVASPPSLPKGNLAPSTNDVTEAFEDYNKKKNSINPMDTNWGGSDYTESKVCPTGPCM